MKSNFTPDKYQRAIREAFVNTDCHLFIDAKAGSGKTTTLTYLMEAVPEDIVAVSLAFSKRIQMELQTRVPTRIGSLTLHSYGFSALRKAGIDKLEKWKVDKIIRDLSYPKEYAQPIKELVSLYKNTLNSDLEYLSETYNIEWPKAIPFEQIRTWANRILEEDIKIAQQDQVCDYDDQLWLPIQLGLKLSTYDLIFVDETQDLNPIQIKLIQGASANNGRVICVADKKQSIFGFRAADPRSIDNLFQYLDQTPRKSMMLPLSISYRCAKKVVAEAQELVPSIEAAPQAPEGRVEKRKIEDLKKLLGQMQPRHIQPASNGMRRFMILSRTNAPLMPWYLLLQKLKLPVSFRSNLAATQLQGLLSRCSNYHRLTVAETCQNLRRYIDQVGRVIQDPLARAGFNDKIQTLIDFIISIPQTEDTLTAHYKEIDRLLEDRFNPADIDPKPDTILLSTVHCAKGLEAENVFIIRPELLPHPLAKKQMEKEQEENIKYVAITRAAKHLYYIEGSEEELNK